MIVSNEYSLQEVTVHGIRVKHSKHYFDCTTISKNKVLQGSHQTAAYKRIELYNYIGGEVKLNYHIIYCYGFIFMVFLTIYFRIE